ncbi:MAG: ABC transporter substrate-binding protein [Stappiaceae bacterium]
MLRKEVFSRASWRAPISGLAASLAMSFFGSIAGAQAETIKVTDIAGRSVDVKKGVERVILGEGRMMYSLAVLDKDDPFGKVVGWKDDLIKYDPDAYRKFKTAFPKAEKIKNFGSPYSGDFSIESAIALDTDLVVLNLGNLFKAEETGVIENLEKAGIPVIFIDFRKRPTQNTVPSLQLLGRVFDKEQQAQEFVDFYMTQMRRVTNIVDGIANEDRPLVFMENAPGWNPEFCCNTFGSANLGKLIDEAGGVNWGATVSPAYSVDTNLESILAADPEVIIGTGANWAEDRPSVTSVLLGYDAEAAAVQERLKALSDRNGWTELKSVKNKRFHSVYHQFYNSPYHFVALQAFAKWFHPDEFEDLDPQATFEELHARFLPFSSSGVFWATLQ